MSHIFYRVPVSSLPAALKQLVKMTGKRLTTVDVALTEEPAQTTSNYRTVVERSLGELYTEKDTSWMGSDGEWNSQRKSTWTGPAILVDNTFNRRAGKYDATIYLGDLTGAEIAAAELVGVQSIPVVADLSIGRVQTVAGINALAQDAVTRARLADVVASTPESNEVEEQLRAAGWL